MTPPPTEYLIRIELPAPHPSPGARPTVSLEPQGQPGERRTFRDVDELLRHLWLLLDGRGLR
ncbi:hypothetical protein [Deinococcus radiotolerans]|uniref:Uncharacterized protein n=1 Tax=Deinococcus radiotolerans TaxID=1309407 RepID=A0ABQ2FE73_9DEIO|nr:hypothetical protein [Deinococcus radiotolerans]GGK89121.1 hypothetical protein GCM10010844_04560 [Deinococcus radiotolerans]